MRYNHGHYSFDFMKMSKKCHYQGPASSIVSRCYSMVPLHYFMETDIITAIFMPIKKSSFKDLRKSRKRTARNKKILENIRYLLRICRKLLGEKKDVGRAKDWVAKSIQALDKAAQKGIIKKNQAARKKSRLLKLFHSAEDGSRSPHESKTSSVE